jgi:hypothetical protein
MTYAAARGPEQQIKMLAPQPRLASPAPKAMFNRLLLHRW